MAKVDVLSAWKALPVLLTLIVPAIAAEGIASSPKTALHKQAPAPTITQNSTEALTVNDNASDGVAAVVNDSIISDYDLRQRVALFVATSGIRAAAENLKNIQRQVLANWRPKGCRFWKHNGRRL